MNYSLVLASGGIDSTACINFYKNLGYNVEALFIDYAQSSKDNEIQAITEICDFYKIKLRIITIEGDINYKSGLILGRNAFLYFVALMNFTKKNGIIASGIHSGTPYYDCSQAGHLFGKNWIELSYHYIARIDVYTMANDDEEKQYWLRVAAEKKATVSGNKRDREVRYMLWLDKELMKNLKHKAVEMECSVKDLVDLAVRHYLKNF